MALMALAPSVLGFPTQAQPKTLQLQARDGPGHPFVCTDPPADEVARRKVNLLSEGATALGKFASAHFNSLCRR